MKLIFSQAITLTNAQPMKVTLGEETRVLDEVVVTALGIKRSEKALTYNVQQVKQQGYRLILVLQVQAVV